MWEKQYFEKQEKFAEDYEADNLQNNVIKKAPQTAQQFYRGPYHDG